MRTKSYFLATVLLILILPISSFCCTSGIFTGKVTADGRALLWKHRDTGEENNRIMFFKGEKYDFLALVNSQDTTATAWAGTNSVGFSIMNTASYNLKTDKLKDADREGELMYKALSLCKTLEDFEKFLRKQPKPLGVEANFGVIDAEGGAAYFETNNSTFVKLDVNDPRIAPDGYLIYTNFSYTGERDKGMGYIRYNTANELVSKQAPFRNITPHWIFNNLSRSFYHSLMGFDLKKGDSFIEKYGGWFADQDFIPRKSSSASIVIQGVKSGENSELTTMWTILGYPPAGIAIPLWVKAGEDQPSFMVKSDTSMNAKACDLALVLKYKSFSLKRGNGSKYMNFKTIYNSQGTGYMQRLMIPEEKIKHLYSGPLSRWRKTGIELTELKELNNRAEAILLSDPEKQLYGHHLAN
ncbi:MAG: hypothetical protein PHP30_10150 [Bacteroidales bacterium]|nr:hypothetical protein [Bacteroidales bacterium]